MRNQRYRKFGYRSQALILGQAGAVATLDATACGRLNLIFRVNSINKRFSIHPSKSKRKSDSQVRLRVGRVMLKHKADCLSCWPASMRVWNAFGFPPVQYLACMCLTYISHVWVDEQNCASTVEVHLEEAADVPDIIMLERSGADRRTLFAAEAKTK